MPSSLDQKLTLFQKLLVLRTFRPDKMVPAIQDFITEALGKKFIEPPPFNLSEIYKDSSSTTPLIFILSPGSDPLTSLLSFSNSMKKETFQISLGQGCFWHFRPGRHCCRTDKERLAIRGLGCLAKLPFGCDLDVDFRKFLNI